MNSPSNSPLGSRADTDDSALVRAYLADNPRLSAGACLMDSGGFRGIGSHCTPRHLWRAVAAVGS